MNVTLDDDARELRDLAAQVLARRTSPEQLEATEATADRFDLRLWEELATTGREQERLSRDIARLKDLLDAVYGSRSWKISRPLRRLSGLLRGH